MTEIRIERLAYGGEGLGRLGEKVCFVEGALPGERAEIEILQDKKKFFRARAVKILEPSAEREAPPCPYYGTCGGCQYQHVSYAAELAWKEIQVREHLRRNLGLDENVFRPIAGSPRAYGYRTSVTLHASPRGAGFFGRDNTTVVPVASCLLADERLAGVFQKPFPGGAEDVTYRVSASGEIVSSREERESKSSLPASA